MNWQKTITCIWSEKRLTVFPADIVIRAVHSM